MKMKDLLLLLLTIIFVILSIFYIVSVCNYDIKELFITKFSAEGKECDLDSIIGKFSTLNTDAKYTSQVLRSGSAIEDYHINYNCNNTKYEDVYLREYTDIKSRDLLLAYGCIKIKPSSFANDINRFSDTLNNNSYIVMLTDNEQSRTYVEVEYADIDELTRKIDAKIKQVINTAGSLNTAVSKLYFPIYVFISQAPYLKNSTEDIKVTDSNRGADGSNFESCSTNYVVKNSERCPGSFKMKADVAILFLGLNKDGAFITDNNTVNNSMITLTNIIHNPEIKSNSKQCFLKCGTINDTHACGCLNLKNSYTANNKSYNSVCLTNNSPRDMTMVYFVNPYANTYSNNNYGNKPSNLNDFSWYGIQAPS
jgi:hypothetical protein